MKIHPLVFILSLTPQLSWGLNLYNPANCQGFGSELESLEVLNQSSEPEDIWLLYRVNDVQDETIFSLSPKKPLRISPEDLPKASSFSITSHFDALSATSICKNGLRLKWSTHVHSFRSWTAQNSGTHKIFFQNLHPLKQVFTVRVLNSQRLQKTSFEVLSGEYLESSKVDFQSLLPGDIVEIQAQGRMSADVFLEQKPLSSVYRPVKVSVKKAAYFMLADQGLTESYIVKIEDPVLIEKARYVIKNKIFAIAIAEIEPSDARDNRDLLTSWATPYSWRVSRVTSIDNLGWDTCSGSPQGVEEYIFSWLEKKQVCFWSFSFYREVTPEEVSLGRLK